MEERTSYQILCSVLHVFSEHLLAAIFLSTSSNLGSKNLPTRLWPSARETNEVEPFHPPISELLPFDEWEDYIVPADSLTINDVNETGFMARFGRPLCVHKSHARLL